MSEHAADSHSGSNLKNDYTYADESSIDEIQNFKLNGEEQVLCSTNIDYDICTF